MKRLWAPWRMEYIERVDDAKKGCFLCAAAECRDEEDEKQRFVLWRTGNWMVVMNRWPYNNGHLLIAPVRHISDIEAVEDEQFAEFGSLVRRCKRRLSQVMSPEGFNLGLNLGRIAGAGVEDHLHWHIVPRWNGDTNFMPVTASTKVIPQSLRELYELLRQ